MIDCLVVMFRAYNAYGTESLCNMVLKFCERYRLELLACELEMREFSDTPVWKYISKYTTQ